MADSKATDTPQGLSTPRNGLSLLDFSHLTRTQAEEEILGAAIDSEAALHSALCILPVEPFSHWRYRDPFYALAGWLARGAYDPDTNRERLQVAFPDLNFDPELRSNVYWCPWSSAADYVEALCRALAESARLEAAAQAAVRAWTDGNPLQFDDEEDNRPRPPTPKDRFNPFR